MNSHNSIIKTGGVNNSPLLLYQPLNFIVLLSFYSPIIIAISIVSLSFVFQNFKGFIYLGFLLGCCILRNYAYMISGSNPIVNDNTICTSIQYSKYGNATFSAFVFAFTIMYLSLPMFMNGDPNFWVFISLLVYFFLDMFIKLYKNCVIKMNDLFLNILLGLTLSGLIVSAMYAGGSGSFLFFNEISSNMDKCSMPNKQTFKCSVYKNGELIGGV
jgi:hypothetical protein